MEVDFRRILTPQQLSKTQLRSRTIPVSSPHSYLSYKLTLIYLIFEIKKVKTIKGVISRSNMYMLYFVFLYLADDEVNVWMYGVIFIGCAFVLFVIAGVYVMW